MMMMVAEGISRASLLRILQGSQQSVRQVDHHMQDSNHRVLDLDCNRSI